jgi:hypothetical protein
MSSRSTLTRTIGELLRTSGESTALEDLGRRGVRRVRVVRAAQLEALIDDAIDRAVDGLRHETIGLGQAILDAERAGEPNFGRGLDVATLAELIGACGATSVGETQRIAVAVAGFVRAEEERLRAEAAGEQRERVELLELRLARLNGALAETESALREAAANAGEQGIASIHRSLAGIRATTKDFQRKWSLLSDIFEKNVELQNVGIDAGA